MKKATVIKTTGSRCVVIIDNEQYQCSVAGKIRLKELEFTNPLAVGDKVMVEIIDEADNTGRVEEILARENYIIRKAVKLSSRSHVIAANIDMAYLVVTNESPETSSGFVDRFIATAEAYHIPSTLIFNKSDILSEQGKETRAAFMNLYSSLGYPCIITSATKNEGINELKDMLANKVNLFAGHSGVGKSTLINALVPELNIATDVISAAHEKGKHTTTFAEMYQINNGGFIIDTPGIREFGTIDFNKAEISHYFVEMRELLLDCAFNNCLHLHEAKCAIKQAVEEGRIAGSRYHNYLSILENKDLYR
ncbi:MAG: ribosome small subunit-dependent GTPase A [Bacteroidia bacterium]|nr:ribosome small subunit-dependent GTPase A [Bacteroidia bacterium]